MPSRPRFWSALETFPGLAAPAAEWRSHLGTEWSSSQCFLRPTGERAELLLVGGQPHRVIEHEPGRVAVVPEEGGPATRLPSEDASILRADLRVIERAVASALELEPCSGASLSATGGLVGRKRLSAATACEVHLCVSCDPAATAASIFKRLSASDEPQILLTPCRVEGDDIPIVARLRSSLLLALEDTVSIADDLSASLTPEANSALDRFAQVVRRWETGDAPAVLYRFQRVGRVWIVAFEGRCCYVPHKEASGMAYLQHLLARPHQPIPVEHLERMVDGEYPLDSVAFGDEVIDREGLAVIWKRLQVLNAELDRAKDDHDEAAEDRARTEIDALNDEVRRIHGLNDRVREMGDEGERLRTKITNSIRRALGVLKGEHPPLTGHLAALQYGRVMAYRPAVDLDWTFS